MVNPLLFFSHFASSKMVYSAPRLPTFFCEQLSPPKYGAMHNNNKRREVPTFSLGNLIPRYREQHLSNYRGYLKWEIGSSSTDEMCLQESGGNSESPGAMSQTGVEEEKRAIDEKESNLKKSQTLMLSIVPLPYLILAALPGATTVRSVFGPFADLVKTWSLPDWLVHWGHPGNMAVVLFAMGGYGSYLGWQIRLSNDVEVKAKAKDLHPKLLGGMYFFFALGATGGITSLLTQDKPIFESPHAVTGLIGLTLLTIQTVLPALFEGNPKLRSVHGFLGSGIMLLFFIHAVLGLQLGLSI